MIFQNKEKRLKKKKEKLKNDIAFLDLKLKKQAYKKALNSGKFSKRIINFCISFTAIFGIMCLYVQSTTGYDTYPLLKVIAAVFGGELLLLLFKRLWSNNDESIDTFVTSFKNKIKTNKKQKRNNSEMSICESAPRPSEISNDLKDTISDINSQIGVG